MNHFGRLIGVVLGATVLTLTTGCLVERAFGGTGGLGSSTVWSDQVEQELRVDTSGIAKFHVRTHNGSIQHTGTSVAGSTATVVVTKKGGGRTMADAEAALAAIQIVSKTDADGVHRLGWEWSGKKGKKWVGQVCFQIEAPKTLRFDGKTHNGEIRVSDVAANVKVVTHNGQIHVDGRGSTLYAETHNGEVVADYEGEDVTLRTHNGGVTADLGDCTAIDARIETHNGGVELLVGQAASAKLECETHNGRIRVDLPMSATRHSQDGLKGILGEGEGELKVQTHNGSISVKKAT